MKYTKAALFFVVLAGASFGFFSVIHSVQMQSIRKSLQTAELVGGLLPTPVQVDGISYLVPPDQLFDVGSTKETLPSIDEPTFSSPAALDDILSDEVAGIIIAGTEGASFYSYQILNWHEVVNTETSGVKIAVTHCTLCKSSAVFNRVVDGQELHFDISGKVYNNVTVLEDRETHSLWLQESGKAIAGPMIGKELELIQAPVMTWGNFKDAFPDGLALSTETGYDREYERHPYSTYDDVSVVYFPLNAKSSKVSQKWMQSGVTINGEHMAFVDKIMEGRGVQHETLGGESIVAIYDVEHQTTSLFYARTEKGTDVHLSYDFDTNRITDDTGGQWTPFGVATSGEHEGDSLVQIPSVTSFWFCWYAIHPDTRISQIE